MSQQMEHINKVVEIKKHKDLIGISKVESVISKIWNLLLDSPEDRSWPEKEFDNSRID